MVNRVDNLTATGGWQALSIPRGARNISIQTRTSIDMQYRYRGQDAYWTIKAGNSATLAGVFNPSDVSVMAVAGTVIEVEFSMYGQLNI